MNLSTQSAGPHSMLRPLYPFLTVILFVLCSAALLPAAEPPDLSSTPALSEHCRKVLKHTLQNEERWVKVHAAEFLIALEDTTGVAAEFEQQLQQFGMEPKYRVGIHRVRTRLHRLGDSCCPSQVPNLVQIFVDTDSPDRIHAVETLGKLNVRLDPAVIPAVQKFAKQGPVAGRAYAWWVLLNHDVPGAEAQLTQLLTADEPLARLTAAFVLGQQETVSNAAARHLQQAAENEPVDSSAHIYLQTAAYRHASQGPAKQTPRRDQLQAQLQNGTPGQQYVLAQLAAHDGTSWLPALHSVLAQNDTSADARSAAAFAILTLLRSR